MKNLKRISVIAVFLLVTAGSMAQEGQSFNLKQAIETAIRNNIDVRQTSLLADVAAVNWRQSRMNL